MFRQRPDSLALIVAFASTLAVLAVFLADLLLSRKHDLDNGTQLVQRFGVMMAEHTARSFDAIDILLREMATDLTVNRRQWTKWSPAEGWEYVAQHHSRSMPQLRDLIVFDRDGNQRFISTYYPPPRINVRDRPYFAALAGGAETTAHGPYVGRNSGRYTYALARRINDADGTFAGVAFAALEPAYLQEFCWSSRLGDDFEALLINTRNEIIASCRPTDVSRLSAVIGNTVEASLFNGRLRGQVPERGLVEANGIIVAVAPVQGFRDLRVLTAIPVDTLLAGWLTRLWQLGTLAVLVTAILLAGGVMVRRQVRDMRKMTAELAASHQMLEERVQTATQELAGQRDDADRASRAKSRFLAAASHDLRQPMHALALFAADLQRQVRSGQTSDLPRTAEQIAVSTALLGELLDSLLDISRLDVAGIVPDLRPFPLATLFLRQRDATRAAAAERRLSIRFHPTSWWVHSDPVMVERMIGNLLSNAIRYTPPGGRILIGARRRKGEIRVEVRDSGVGIPAEYREAVFTEFFQVGNTAREHDKGLGLGLSIVDRLAKALNVPIGLCSRVGEGTTFTLTLPPASPPLSNEPEALTNEASTRVHFVGNSAELAAAARLAESWEFEVSQEEGPDGILPDGAVLVADAGHAAAVLERLVSGRKLVVLGNTDGLNDDCFCLGLPLRPAKLRALLNQVQKTSAKSIP